MKVMLLFTANAVAQIPRLGLALGLCGTPPSGVRPAKARHPVGRIARVVCVWLLFAGMAWSNPAVAASGVTTLTRPHLRYTVPEKGYVVMHRGPVESVIVDNRAVRDQVLTNHGAGYHGVALLRHEKQQRNLFVPTYAGLNFEHIHDGTVKPGDVLFEPRRAPMELRALDPFTVELYQPPTPFWGLESCSRYALREDGSIDVTFECIPRRATFTNGYCGLFWASYIDHPESLDVHFRGVRDGEEGSVDWVRGITPAHGTLATHRPWRDSREFVHDARFPLELPFGFSQYRYREPWFFGICRSMAFVQSFRPADQVWLSQSPSGGGRGCPAWDFQWYLPSPQVGQLYQLKMRALYVPLSDAGDETAVRSAVRQRVKRSGVRY